MENERVEREQSQFQEDVSIDSRKPPPWRKQITVRSIVASLLIGIVYSVICLKLNLTTGLVPNLNISSALLAFVFLKSWTKVLQKAGIVTTPFTRQENTIAQTCAVACYSISLAGNSQQKRVEFACSGIESNEVFISQVDLHRTCLV